MTIRLVLAEDNALLREGLTRLIDAEPTLDLVGTAADLPALFDLIETHSPDVVVSDIRMPPTNTDEGVQMATRLRESHPKSGVVLLSQHADVAYAHALLEGGTAGRGYLLKERVSDVGELTSAITAVADGGSVLDPSVVEQLVTANLRRTTSKLDALSPRELEVLGEMTKGGSNAT